MAVDDLYTMALLHLEGADASNVITDENGRAWTARGNAQLDTGVTPKFGTASLLLDGNSDWVDTPDHADLQFGSGNFTIDMWVRPTAGGQSNGSILAIKVDNITHYAPYTLYLANGTYNVLFSASSTGSSWNLASARNAGTITQNVWNHIALVRSGIRLMCFVNGVLGECANIGTASFYQGATTTTTMIGGGNYSSSYITGNIDEVRISKGIARWVSDFTPPRSPYPLARLNHLKIRGRNRLYQVGVSLG